MAITKLTLSVDRDVVNNAKRLARERNTSISALFERFIVSLLASTKLPPEGIGPITRKASGLIKMEDGSRHEDILAEALADKYGFKR